MSTTVARIKHARSVFNSNRTKPRRFRRLQLENFLKFLQQNQQQLTELITKDTRKNLEEARLELTISVNHLRYLLLNFARWTKRESLPRRFIDWLDGIYSYSDPLGVVLVIGAWNVPLLTLLPVAGAIAAGNCVVIKPSHNSPHFGAFIQANLQEYLDEECYPVILGDVKETNLVLEQRFDYIYYTGSINVGRIVHAAANKYLTPVTLEMGGKNAVYIDDSAADLLRTTRRIMWGKCFNSGQACICPDYLLCSKKVEIEFIKHAKSVLCEFFGDNVAKSCPIINDLHFNRLVNMLKDQQVAMGGQICPMENFIEPTILTNVKESAAVMQDEIFGPILPILNVENVKQAVEFINRQEKALALYIFAEDGKVCDYFLENTSCGGVTVNDTLMHFIVENLPFGGVGMSGMGRYKGKDSFDTFVHKKSVCVKRMNAIMELFNFVRYPPYSLKKSKMMGMIIRSRWLPLEGWWGYILAVLVGVVLVEVMLRLIF